MKNFILTWFFFLLVAASADSPCLHRQSPDMTAIATSDETDHVTDNVCWKTLSCSLAEIESMGMTNRMEFVKYMGVQRLGQLASSEQFHAVEGVMEFFIRRDLGHPGSWMSVVNAAVVEAIERGAAMSLGLATYTGGNPAAIKWARYFDKRARGHLRDRSGHDVVWAVAEQTAVDYGTRLADTTPGVEDPPSRELRWSQFTRIYRTIMQFRRTILWFTKAAFSFTDPGIPMATEAFIDWFTDVTHTTSTGFLADVAWALSALRFSKDGGDPVADSEVMMQIITEFWEAFQRREEMLED